jgi:heat shock protein HtpX
MVQPMRVVRVPLLLFVVGAVIASVVTLALVFILPMVVAIIVGLVAGVAAAAFVYLRSDAAVLGSLQPEFVDQIDEPRLHNMIDGLCDSHGFRRPRLALVDAAACNAMVYGRSHEHTTLVVTTGLRDALTRMELEGLLARELALATHDGLAGATVVVPLLGLMPESLRTSLLTWWIGAQRSMLDDFDAVRFTRYPPGLAAALDKLAGASTVVAGAGRYGGHLWVAPPTEAGSPAPTQPTIDARAAALREL